MISEEKTADKYLSVQRVAETLSCSDDYVYMLIRDGKIQAIKIGQRAIRISDCSLQEFIVAGRINPEDYYAPEEPPEQAPPARKPETAQMKVARSSWMLK